MGLRLNISYITEDKNFDNVIKQGYYGTKYFGYEADEDSLSFKYLVSIGKLEKDDIDRFYYNNDFKIPLNFNEFLIFVNLYNLDLNNRINNFSNDLNYFINDEEIKKLIENEYLIYILEWM